MNVEKKKMYHISRENNWEIGEEISAGERENPFWCICKDYSKIVELDDIKMSIFQMFDRNPKFELTKHNIIFLYENLKEISKETALYIREQIFEDVRIKNYPTLPSRQKCLWVCEENQIDYWKTINENRNRSLLVLELNGEIFCADDYWLTADTFSSIVYTERAKHYWAGEMSNESHKEFLFYGKATVKEIHDV